MARGPSAASNPFSTSRMKDNLHARPTPGSSGPQGNRTASQTVLGPSSRGTRQQYLTCGRNDTKRLKLDHEKETEVDMERDSRFFENDGKWFVAASSPSASHAVVVIVFGLGSAAGTGAGKGKGKDKGKGKANGKETAPLRGLTADDPETLSEGEDTGEIVDVTPPKVDKPKETTRKSDSPDPIDLFAGGLSSDRTTHPFDAPSKRGPERRLAEDGDSTLRLKARQKQGPVASNHGSEMDLSSDIEMSDDVTPAQGRKTTPNGRTQIPKGAVQSKIRAYESSSKQSTRGVLNMQPVSPATPFVNFKDQKPGRQSIKNAMKGKNAKSPPQQQSLAVFTTHDPVAASASGFSTPLARLIDTAGSIPLEAWSMGCDLEESENGTTPVAWLTLQHVSKQNRVTLKVVRNPQDKKGALREFYLDCDFDDIEYSDTVEEWKHDSVVMIMLRSTRSMKSSPQWKLFRAGDRQALGAVSFKLMTRHPNLCNGEKGGRGQYKALVDVLLRQIKEGHHVLKPNIASQRCWETVRSAAEMVQARSTTSRQSPASAGSSKTPTALDIERTSVSAPPSRTYGSSTTERRQTRQSTRSTRASPTPDLDELILVYPFSGTGAVNVTRGDLKRLDPGQYLNDTIIEFGLKVWLDGLRKDHPELAEQVHVFNSFFYKKLVTKKNVAETYASVRKWTSKVDIFSKKYIIVPINENFHWYLAIIENPKNMLHPPPPPVQGFAPQTRQTRKRKRESAAADAEAEGNHENEAVAGAAAETVSDETTIKSKESSKQPSEPPSEPLPDTMAIDGPESEGEVEVENLLHATQSCSIGEPEGDRDRDHDHAHEAKYPMSDEPMDVDALSAPGTEVEVEKKPPDREPSEPITVDEGDNAGETVAEAKPDELDPESKEPTKEGSADGPELAALAAGPSEYPTCYIYTFDSLGSRHVAAGKHLAHYLQHEAADKKNYPLEDTCLATYKAAKAPMQPNFCDCGVFVLAFVEAFMRDPDASSEAIRRSQLSWWDSSLTDLRETFRDRTIVLSEQWKKERAAKEGAKVDNVEDKVPESAKAKPNGKARPSPEVVPDSEDDEIEISAVHIPPKPVSRGGKDNATKATRLRG